MKVEVTILTENTAPVFNLIGEYGLSMMVKVDNHCFLFDTGLDGAILHNAEVLGIKLEEIEAVIISHGHRDHSGGLTKVLRSIGSRKVHLHPWALQPKYVGRGVHRRLFGMDSRDEIEKCGGKLVFNERASELIPGVILSGFIPRQNNWEDTGGVFTTDYKGQEIVDNMDDDQALIIDHTDGLIIVSGCAHSGMINTLEHAVNITGNKKVKAWIGGTHLMAANPERLEMTIKGLKTYDFDRIVVSHCTGFKPAALMMNKLGPIVEKGECGMVIRF